MGLLGGLACWHNNLRTASRTLASQCHCVQAGTGEPSVLEAAMNSVLGARDTNAWRDSTSKAGASRAGPDCSPFGVSTKSAWGSADADSSQFSPLTQQRSQMQTPELRQGGAAASAADDVSSSSRGVTPEWGGGESSAPAGQRAQQQHAQVPPPAQQQQQQQQQAHQQAPGSAPPSRPASAAGPVAAAVDAADVRRLVNTVEALQVDLMVSLCMMPGMGFWLCSGRFDRCMYLHSIHHLSA